MAIYTFFCRTIGGTGDSFEAYDLACDQQAATQSAALLELHMSASHIEVFDHDREVLTRSRSSLALSPMADTAPAAA